MAAWFSTRGAYESELAREVYREVKKEVKQMKEKGAISEAEEDTYFAKIVARELTRRGLKIPEKIRKQVS